MLMAAIPPIRTKFFYGWIVVAVAFVSMGIAVNTRTAFSLLYPPILDEFGWERGATAGAFSLGFLASTAAVPLIGMMIDRYGPRVVLPLLQAVIEASGWRAACQIMAVLCALLIPLNFLFQRKSPEGFGLRPDGESSRPGARAPAPSTVVDKEWTDREWTLATALRTGRFWWVAAAFFCALYAWYTVQVHQTRYLADVGFGAGEAAFALGLVGLCGVVGQIWIGHFSDRIGREWAWTIGMSGFIVTGLALLALDGNPSRFLMYMMVAAQGLFGYGVASVFGAMPAELFSGRRYATIFGMLSVFGNLGAGIGPWLTGDLYDRTGSYQGAFMLLIVLSFVSIACIWLAAPRKVRLVAGQAARRAIATGGG
jgi:sugar phosphate permease